MQWDAWGFLMFCLVGLEAVPQSMAACALQLELLV